MPGLCSDANSFLFHLLLKLIIDNRQSKKQKWKSANCVIGEMVTQLSGDMQDKLIELNWIDWLNNILTNDLAIVMQGFFWVAGRTSLTEQLDPWFVNAGVLFFDRKPNSVCCCRECFFPYVGVVFGNVQKATSGLWLLFSSQFETFISALAGRHRSS